MEIQNTLNITERNFREFLSLQSTKKVSIQKVFVKLKGKKFVWNEIKREMPVLISAQAEIHSRVGIIA